MSTGVLCEAAVELCDERLDQGHLAFSVESPMVREFLWLPLVFGVGFATQTAHRLAGRIGVG